MATSTTIRIGGACGFWGESPMGVGQLLRVEGLDYLVFDYLAEITMSILARARAADDQKGYATDFVAALAPCLETVAARGVKVVSNAGGVNPAACAAALEAEIARKGLDLTVGVVAGDDLTDRAGALAEAGIVDMTTGAAFPAPDQIASINAYLGAFPIAAALDAGADIVITGRCVDSAVVLGPCIHAFGWRRTDWDLLAAGSVAGHIIECGPQATGGNFTDWDDVAEGLADIGYPIAEIASDGAVAVTKPRGTGGAVTPATVGEQLLYEIGDPQAYVLPDVVVDLSHIRLHQDGPDRVRLAGAKGRPAPDRYKVSATFADGFRAGHILVFYGEQADRKARSFADAVLERARNALSARGLPDFTETCVELIGDESHYGDHRAVVGSREVALKLAVKHASDKAVGGFLKEVIGAALAAPPGLTLFSGGGRPKPSPVVRLFSFLIPKDQLTITVGTTGASAPQTMETETGQPFDAAGIARPAPPAPPALGPDAVPVPLIKLAWARSGDKGNSANVGVLARDPRFLPYIWAALSEAEIAARFRHFLAGKVVRYLLPGPAALNIVLTDVLGGGGVASLRNDPQGKGYSQILLQTPIPVPAAMAESL